jgi:hypothetical protein
MCVACDATTQERRISLCLEMGQVARVVQDVTKRMKNLERFKTLKLSDREKYDQYHEIFHSYTNELFAMRDEGVVQGLWKVEVH